MQMGVCRTHCKNALSEQSTAYQLFALLSALVWKASRFAKKESPKTDLTQMPPQRGGGEGVLDPKLGVPKMA